MQIDLRQIPVIWINLDSALSNKEKMIKQFDEFGFKNHQRFSAITPKILEDKFNFKNNNYVHACGMSHYEILKNTSQNTPILILEDDAKITQNFNPILDIPENIDGVYVGTSTGNKYYKSRKFDNNFLRVSGILSTHAILYISNRYKNAVAETIFNFVFKFQFPFDVGISQMQEKNMVLAPNKPYFIQSDDRDSEHKWEHFTSQALENRESIFNDNIPVLR